MRGLFIDRGEVRFRADLAPPLTATGECRVRVLRAGVCATDLALVRGYMGFSGIPGHEFVGECLEGPLEGQRVVGEINAGCGSCTRCRAGDPRHCPGRTVLGILGRGGAFAEQLVLPASNLHAVPAGVSDDAATFTEPLAAAYEIMEQIAPAPGTRALVLGDGRLGLLCAQVLAAGGLEVVLEGRHPEREVFLPDSVRYAGPENEGETGFELVVEATGRPQVLQSALARLRPRGTLVLKTTSEAPAELDLALLVVNELRLVGSRCGPFAPALAALEAQTVLVEPMIAARFPLEEGARALAEAARPGVLKVLIDPSLVPG